MEGYVRPGGAYILRSRFASDPSGAVIGCRLEGLDSLISGVVTLVIEVWVVTIGGEMGPALAAGGFQERVILDLKLGGILKRSRIKTFMLFVVFKAITFNLFSSDLSASPFTVDKCFLSFVI